MELERGQKADNAYPDLAPSDYVSITVTDTGRNILDKEFEPFFTTTELGKSSGTRSLHGLWLRQAARRPCLDLQRGRHRLGRKVLLPRAVDACAMLPVREEENIPQGQVRPCCLVEDDADVRDLIVAHLTALVYQALQAPDALAAKERRATILPKFVKIPILPA